MLFNEPLKRRLKSRVELHVHLDGAIRHETIWEVMRQKGLPLPGNGSLGDLKEALKVQEPKDLAFFLQAFSIFMPAIVGDTAVIERISYEFVEDQSKESVAYCEARFSPHLLLPDNPEATGDASHLNGSVNGVKAVVVEDILDAVLKGLSRGTEQFGTKVRVILCCIRGHPEWSWDVLRLCEEYKDRGVVGIDLAGDEAGEETSVPSDEEVSVFEAAKEKGIHRTMHAGEAGPAKCVKTAVEVFGAERIGHGYRVVEDEEVFKMCLRENIHFETCPHSSYLTGSMQSLTAPSKRHPILRFAEDEVSFSINTDDPTVTNTRLSDEYKLLNRWGLTEAHLTRANFQAALHSFLPPEEKKELIEQLREAYGFIHYAPSTSSSTSPSGTRSSTPPLKPSVTFGTWADRS